MDEQNQQGKHDEADAEADRRCQAAVSLGQPDIKSSEEEAGAAQARGSGKQICDGRTARPPDGLQRLA